MLRPPRRATRPSGIAGRKNLLQLVGTALAGGGRPAGHHPRWCISRCGVPLPLVEMLTLLAGLALFNVASMLRARLALPVGNGELFAALLVDVAVLTGQLYLRRRHRQSLHLPLPAAGGAGLGAAAAGATCGRWWRSPVLCFVGTDAVAPAAATCPGSTRGSLSDRLSRRPAAVLPARMPRCWWSSSAASAATCASAMPSWPQLRQRAAEEEHIVRMGLLASGAAHELGTPLATLSVILGDWARMAPFAGEPELREEIEEMQRQIAALQDHRRAASYCRPARRAARPPVQTTLHAFLDDAGGGVAPHAPASTSLAYRAPGCPGPADHLRHGAQADDRQRAGQRGGGGAARRAAAPGGELRRRRAEAARAGPRAPASAPPCCSGWASPTSPARAGRAAVWACSSPSTSRARWADRSRRTIRPKAAPRC